MLECAVMRLMWRIMVVEEGWVAKEMGSTRSEMMQ